MPMSASQWALLILLSILWGGSFFFVGVAVKELPPLTLVLARVAIAALALAPLVWAAGLKLPTTVAGWTPFIGMAILNNVVPFVLVAAGQKQVASSIAAVLNASTPVWSLLIAHAFTTDEKLRANKLIGALLGLVGVAALVGPETLFGSHATVFGMLCVLGSAIFYGFSALWGRRLRGKPPLLTTFCQLTCASLMLLPITLAVDMPWTLAAPSLHVVGSILGLALLSTALAYIIFFRILTVSGPTNAMLVTLLVPVTAIAAGVLILGETLLMRHIIGALVIGSGLIVIDGRALSWLRSVSGGTRG